MSQWKIHAYLSSILPSYVKLQTTKFALAHTDLSASNILIDPETGLITGIIDWEFACTVPSQAMEHFPVLLRKDVFLNQFENVYDDPEAELNEWRAFYAKQFEGDLEMEQYLQNIDAAIAFEDILKDGELATIENLVEECKFLESAETLETMEVPFPWKTPTKHRSPPPPTMEPESETTPTAEITEISAETE
jgi:Ser/Thr protein kinase RdoA (MazF antagonist)